MTKLHTAASFKEPTQEMVDFYEQRTEEHINRVVKFMQLLDGFAECCTTEELTERGALHDEDKYSDELRVPYIWVTEYHRVKNDGQDISDELQAQYDLASEATGAHVEQNLHHPEAHESPEAMSDLDLLEMVADWSAMAEELDEGSARGWADKNMGDKWEFSPEQTEYIYDAIEYLEGQTKERTAATPRRDTEAQRWAAELYEQFVQALSSEEGARNIAYLPNHLMSYGLVDGVGVPGAYLGPNLADATFVLAWGTDDSASVGGYIDRDRRTPDKYLIVIAADSYRSRYTDKKLPFDDVRLTRTLVSRATFIHEFMHYLDIKKWKGYDFGPDAGPADEKVEFDEEYYNDPLEFNAFFQQGAEKMNVYFERMLKLEDWRRDQKLKRFLTPFEDFVTPTKDGHSAPVEGFFDSRFYDMLSPKTRKHFMKRLYGLYMEMQKRAQEIVSESTAEKPEGSRRVRIPRSGPQPPAPSPHVYGGRAGTVVYRGALYRRL